ERAEANVVANPFERGFGGRLVGGEVEKKLRRGVVLGDGDTISGREAFEKRVRSAYVAGLQEIDGRAGFHEQENLCGLVDRSEIGDGLLDNVIDDMEVFAAKTFDKVAT